ncbi:hypothetical protein SAMN05443287_101576 [Micromonospora phaseoli]|uniref:Uncharacterized protein n=1 Tax=Micromonospora phaseoli TaxID=1144548 RepID=A0A1H6SFG9_9ACTN|nr:hypothetical protein [Micromonospora phaseoli]PZW03825.1 hypothetical protein CLV64_101576 [Micromonospora phaseoli]GIJ79127.1 hypothetical protein Xph01_35590 [Micromonospora phaseoli]SEI63547.1 hypothetical protein SAMN05443287_101576 [Micromonospora phaseoli]
MADEIRQALARLAEPVVPQPDPYQRLLRRVRRRRRRQTAATGVAALVLAAVTIPPVGVLGLLRTDEPTLATAAYQPASPIDDPMVRRLLDSPTRGNLAGDTALIATIEREYRAARAELLVDPSLGDVRVLFAHDAPGARVVVVAYLDDSHALIRQSTGPEGASVPELLGQTGTPDEPQELTPYLFFGRYSRVDGDQPDGLAVGLAPAGCRVETSNDGRLQPDGSVVRSWQLEPNDGFVVQAGMPGGRWQFTCDGIVRYAGPARIALRTNLPIASATRPDLSVSAVRELRDMLYGDGLTGSTPQVLWTGRLPARVADAPAAVLVRSCSADGGCAALLKADARALAGPESAVLTFDRTGIGSADLVAVPLAGQTAGVLVAGPESATRAELIDARGSTVTDGPLTGGIGFFEVDSRTIAGVRVLDSADQPLLTAATPHLTADSYEFAEPTVWAW